MSSLLSLVPLFLDLDCFHPSLSLFHWWRMNTKCVVNVGEASFLLLLKKKRGLAGGSSEQCVHFRKVAERVSFSLINSDFFHQDLPICPLIVSLSFRKVLCFINEFAPRALWVLAKCQNESVQNRWNNIYFITGRLNPDNCFFFYDIKLNIWEVVIKVKPCESVSWSFGKLWWILFFLLLRDQTMNPINQEITQSICS